MDKEDVRKAYIAFLEQKVQKTEGALGAIYEGIDTAPGPSQSHSDTTRSQQSRVALETSARLSSLKTTKAAMSFLQSRMSTAPEIGALIVVEDVGFKEKEYYFIVPDGGGESIEFDGIEVLFVSIQAPIIEAVSKVRTGELFEFRGRSLILAEIS